MRLYDYGYSPQDYDLAKSFPEEVRKAAGVDLDMLEKALNRQGLTQKEVQVTQNGKSFTRKQWVKTGDEAKGGGKQESSKAGPDHEKAANVIHDVIGQEDRMNTKEASKDQVAKIKEHLGVDQKSKKRITFEHKGQKFILHGDQVARIGAHPDHEAAQKKKKADDTVMAWMTSDTGGSRISHRS